MAQVFSAPEAPPRWEDYKDKPGRVDGRGLRVMAIQDAEQEYTERMQALARANCADPIAGEIIRFTRGDGYAEYIVWNTKPLQLVWLETGDAYSVEAPLIRGLNLTEVRAMVKSERALAELFGRSATPA
jgi:hypothetical protein